MMDEAGGRARCRELIERGIVPTPVPRTTWAALFKGSDDCLICQERIAASMIDYEVDLAESVTAHLHRRCYGLLLDEASGDGHRPT